MNIYIVGYPCCGKTSLGKKIAKKIGYNFVDLDHLFEEEYKITIPDFFEKYSEEAFRICERKILHSTASLKKTIIATGGGTPCYFDNIDFINKNACVGAALMLKFICCDYKTRMRIVCRCFFNAEVAERYPDEL
jgi:shikimate kinase